MGKSLNLSVPPEDMYYIYGIRKVRTLITTVLLREDKVLPQHPALRGDY